MGIASEPRWQLHIDPEGRSGADNMALDEGLLAATASTARTYLRLYRWQPACLSFGRNEPALRRYDRARIERQGWDVVRRPTGGRAVFHDKEITYAVAAPIAVWGSLKSSYFAIHKVLAEGLSRLGVDAALAEPARAASLVAGPCFASAVGGEVTVDGLKVVGSAQYREGGALLQHGSILIAGSQEVLETVTVAERSTTSGATTLAAILGHEPAFDEIASAVADAAEAAWGTSIAEAPAPTPVAGEKYRSESWTWRR